MPVLEGKEFADHLIRIAPDILNAKKIAVAVSGGADSMALAHLLSRFAVDHHQKLYGFIVDHGLRPESSDESKLVLKRLKALKPISTHILTWRGPKPKTRIQELARQKRYELLIKACVDHGITHLCVAHHANDQMESLLMRLKRGSGLKGLAGMSERYDTGQGVKIIRPCLNVTHASLVNLCVENNIDWIEDPSNENSKFERVRIRRIVSEFFDKEDVDAGHIQTALNRLKSSDDAIDYYVENEHKNYLLESNKTRIVYQSQLISNVPFDVLVRLLLKAMTAISPQRDYAPSLAGVEKIATRITGDVTFRAASLGGCTIRFSRTRKTLDISRA